MNYKLLSSGVALLLLSSQYACTDTNKIQTTNYAYDLSFNNLASTWDEGMPLGNSIIGALIWEKNNKLRMSLDRVDLWDLRDSPITSDPDFSFKYVQEQVRKKDYKPVQDKFDAPYEELPAPSKIPGAALEFDVAALGNVKQNRLHLKEAVNEVEWENGTRMLSFVHAEQPVGWFIFENLTDSLPMNLIPPVYQKQADDNGDQSSVSGLSLGRLGYEQGTLNTEGNKIVFDQKGWDDFTYQVAVEWKQEGNKLIGVWSITSSLVDEKASQLVEDALQRDIYADFKSHNDWWKNFWSKSEISIPDSVIEKQYYNEIYKLGSTARENSYPISLQAVWTADNGQLPPWKGDYHHDLNTQLSYWPAYTGNYLTEAMGYLNTFLNQKEVNKEYTKKYFGTSGLNVPGVCDLQGKPMGGWIQYSLSPTVSAWLSQHFYLQWKYSDDKEFLSATAYPYLKDVATHLEEVSIINKDGQRTLPISSSPEYNDNSITAWFPTITNYDLGLMKFAFKASAEMATALGKADEATHWQELYNQMPAFTTDTKGGLVVAEGHPYDASHRHFSHLMPFHPLGLIDYSNGEADKAIIDASIASLEEFGPGWWTGYSYSWFANMKARAMDGEGAAKALQDFANCFCLRNTFHVNGDQSKSGKSNFTYRPFTLEGNFAFASGVQDMLLQSHTDTIKIFPAVPASWNNISFRDLRAQRGVLVSAQKENGKIKSVTFKSDHGTPFFVKDPFGADAAFLVKSPNKDAAISTAQPGIMKIELKPGEELTLAAE